jgi:DNA mismatch repair protein MutS2
VNAPCTRYAAEAVKAFAVGDRVHIATLGTGVVRELRNGGRYLVELKGRFVSVRAGQLEPAPERREARRAISNGGATRELASRDTASLDLHGKTAEQAVEALDAFLNDALIAGASEARVIHGRSGGTLKAAVHARLRQLPPVRAFRLDPQNPGVTIVQL